MPSGYLGKNDDPFEDCQKLYNERLGHLQKGVIVKNKKKLIFRFIVLFTIFSAYSRTLLKYCFTRYLQSVLQGFFQIFFRDSQNFSRDFARKFLMILFTKFFLRLLAAFCFRNDACKLNYNYC